MREGYTIDSLVGDALPYLKRDNHDGVLLRGSKYLEEVRSAFQSADVFVKVANNGDSYEGKWYEIELDAYFKGDTS